MIHYTITADPHAHLFEVEMHIDRSDPAGQRLAMAAWSPGSYMIRDYARHIVALQAEVDGAAVAVEKVDKQTWRCAPAQGSLVVRYRLYANDLSVRGAHLDTTHGFYNGPALYLRAVGSEDEPCLLELRPPPVEAAADWRVATSLPPETVGRNGFGRYLAATFDELLDHPVEMGCFEEAGFRLAEMPHRLAVTGRHHGDTARLVADLRRICRQHVALFGELPEMPCYLFQLMLVGEGYGGLEHRSSTSLIAERGCMPRPDAESPDDDYVSLLGLCSHEYFHLWNVKRIRPRRLAEADLSSEVYTRLLWAFEGITSYYDDLALVRSGCITPQKYLELLARTITRVTQGRGRFLQTLEESSFDAWTRFYKQDENAPNAIVSYYAKGALTALALDLTIRTGSAGERSLDDLMRALWRRFGRAGRGVVEGDIEQLAEEVSGLELRSFFDRALRGTEDLPLEPLLREVGVGMMLSPAVGPQDRGGLRDAPPDGGMAPATLGATFERRGDPRKVVTVFTGGAAERAGIAPGDLLVALDGIRIPDSGVEALLARMPRDRPLPLHLFRRDELIRVEIVPETPPATTCRLWLIDDAGPATQTLREQWLGAAGGR